MKTNWRHALLAFALAVVAWYFVSGREKVDVWMESSVHFTGMPENLIIRGGLVPKIEVLVRGPKGLIRALESKPLVYSLDLSELYTGVNVIPIEVAKLPLAKTFEVLEVKPSRLEITVDRIAQKQLPVKPLWEGTLDPDYELVDVKATPEFVMIRGPEKIVKDIIQIETQTITLNTTTPMLVEDNVALSLPSEIDADAEFVDVRLMFGLRTKRMSFQETVIALNPDDVKVLKLRPKRVKVEADIPLPLSREKDVAEKISAQIVIHDGLETGKHELSVDVHLPSGGKLVKVTPSKVFVSIRAPQPTVTEPPESPEESNRERKGDAPPSSASGVEGP